MYIYIPTSKISSIIRTAIAYKETGIQLVLYKLQLLGTLNIFLQSQSDHRKRSSVTWDRRELGTSNRFRLFTTHHDF